MGQRREQLYISLAIVRPHCRCKGRADSTNSVMIRHINMIVRTNLGGVDNFVVLEWIKVILDVDRVPFLIRTRAEERIRQSRALHEYC